MNWKAARIATWTVGGPILMILVIVYVGIHYGTKGIHLLFATVFPPYLWYLVYQYFKDDKG